MAIRVGRWDCFVCGHIGNLGPETHCEKCGASRPKDVKFYLPETEEVIKSRGIEAAAKKGADWVCSYCAGHNKVDEIVCKTCGNDREDVDATLQEKTYTLDEIPVTGSRGIKRVTPKKEPKGAAGFFKYILGATGLGGVFYWLFSFSTAVEVPVTQLHWEREVAIETYKEVQEEDWELPSQATNVSQFQAVHHTVKEITGYRTETRSVEKKVGTRKVSCGQKDMGNGYFQEIFCDEPIYETVQEQYEAPVYVERPIYKTKYRYNIFRWVEIEPIKTSGSSNPAKWGEDTPQMKMNPSIYRRGKQKELYKFWIEFKDEQIEHETSSYAFFETLQLGNTITAYKSTIFGTYKGLEK